MPLPHLTTAPSSLNERVAAAARSPLKILLLGISAITIGMALPAALGLGPSYAQGGSAFGFGGAGVGGADSVSGTGSNGASGRPGYNDEGGGGGGAGIIGGAGGSGTGGGVGGTGGTTSNLNGANGTGGVTSAGGGGGGAHGYVGTSSGLNAPSTGGNGGLGGTPTGANARGGGGGAGGYGAVVQGVAGSSTISSTLTGGQGGTGGNGVASAGTGGGGGSGGVGLVLDIAGPADISIDANLTGGNGGDGGVGASSSGRGTGGFGGRGLLIQATSADASIVVSNGVTIAGGNGGASAVVSTSGGMGIERIGGGGIIALDIAGTVKGGNGGQQNYNNPGISGSDFDITLRSGSMVAGGLYDNNPGYASAFYLTGTNTLRFDGAIADSASVMNGRIYSTGTVILDDVASAPTSSLLMSNVVAVTNLVKAGAGTVTLSAQTNTIGTIEIASGTLAISEANNLNAYVSPFRPQTALKLSGGTFGVLQDIDLASVVTFTDATSSTIEIASGKSAKLTGAISGLGDLTVAGGGTLTLTGANSGYHGNITLADGTLALAADEAAGTGALSTTGGALDLNGVRQTVSGFSGSSGTITLTNASINQIGTLVVDQAGATRFGGVFAGQGKFELKGGGSLQLSGDSSAFLGTTKVSNAQLAVNGQLGGSVSVLGDGLLKGTGTLDTVTIGHGGRFAPGNSIGTIHATGAVTFDPGSIYDVEVAADGTSDKIVASSASLNGGTVKVIPLAGAYANATTYTILSTANGYTGAFDGTNVSDLAFLTPTLKQNGNDLQLLLTRRSVSNPNPGNNSGGLFETASRNANQRSAANAAEGLGPGNPLYDALMVQTNDDAAAALQVLSGETHSTETNLMLSNSSYIRQGALGRVNTAMGNSVLSDLDVGQPVDTAPVTDSATAWMGAYGNRAWLNGDGATGTSTSWGGGLQAGVDDWFGDLRLGAMLDIGLGTLTSGDGSSTVDSHNYGLGVYGGTHLGPVNVLFGGSYERLGFKSERSVVFPGFAETLTANYGGDRMQVFGEVNYDIELGASKLTPFGQLAYAKTRIDGFTEAGGASALSVSAVEDDAVFTTLGLRGETSFVLSDDLNVTAGAGIGWRHAFADEVASTHAFASGGDSFTVSGVPVAKDALLLEAGVGMVLSASTTLKLNYTGQLSTSAQDHTLGTTLKIRF